MSAVVTPPNILITGTPGVGKTSTAKKAAKKIDFQYINVGEIVKEHQFYTEYDDTFDTHVLDEDKLIDYLEPIMSNGGNVVDFHSPEIFPERWFELVLVLTCKNEILHDRLQERGYNSKKIEENMECEIMQEVLEETKESYDNNIIHVLESNSTDDMKSNIKRIKQWYKNWLENNQ